jgi:hypothetical protein
MEAVAYFYDSSSQSVAKDQIITVFLLQLEDKNIAQNDS